MLIWSGPEDVTQRPTAAALASALTPQCADDHVARSQAQNASPPAPDIKTEAGMCELLFLSWPIDSAVCANCEEECPLERSMSTSLESASMSHRQALNSCCAVAHPALTNACLRRASCCYKWGPVATTRRVTSCATSCTAAVCPLTTVYNQAAKLSRACPRVQSARPPRLRSISASAHSYPCDARNPVGRLAAAVARARVPWLAARCSQRCGCAVCSGGCTSGAHCASVVAISGVAAACW